MPVWRHNAVDWRDTSACGGSAAQDADPAFCPPRAAARAPTPGPAASRREEASARGSQGTDDQLRRELDHRPRGPRGRPQAPRHVHRLHRRARPAPPGPGGRRQRRRRGAGRLLRHDRGDAAGRRRRAGRRQRPRHPGRHAPGREAAGRRGRADHAARRRQVRRRVLRRVRRPARRRRLRRQRAVHPARRGDPCATDSRLDPGRTPTAGPARCDKGAPTRKTGTTSPSGPTRRSSRPRRTRSRRFTAGCRRWRS